MGKLRSAIELSMFELVYNHFNNMLRLFDVLPIFSFTTTSETMRSYYLKTWYI